MAKVKAPLLGMDASGTVAKAMVFSRWKGRIYVRRHTVPSNPRSPGQMLVRATMKMLVNFWKGGKVAWDADWVGIASEKVISTFNAFTGYNRDRWTMHLMPCAMPDPVATAAPDAPTNVDGTGYKGKIVVTWNDGAANAGDDIMGAIVAISATTVMPDFFVDARGGAYEGVETCTMEHLAAGTYRVTVWMIQTNGELGPADFEDAVVVT